MTQKFRFVRAIGIAAAVVAIAAPGAGAYVVTGESGAHGTRVMHDAGAGAGLKVQSSDIGGAGATVVRDGSDDGFSWLSAIVAGCALAAMGATGVAMTRRNVRREHATLTI